MEREFRLAPINPFTPRQEELIQLILEGVSDNEILARKLDIAYSTVKVMLAGKDSCAGLEKWRKANRDQLGVFGIVERLTGKRPGSKLGLISLLMDDVVFGYEIDGQEASFSEEE